jgi:putative ubiquitin-RnfH superfamily antitoxin RatB of RatAB toxin-antitoxin module
LIDVTIVFSPAPREVVEQVLRLPVGATVQHALDLSDLAVRLPDIDWSTMSCGIWGRITTLDRVLAHGDRIEFCRPLLVDPKVARRERFVQQGARGTGLFAKRRTGGKAGY